MGKDMKQVWKVGMGAENYPRDLPYTVIYI